MTDGGFISPAPIIHGWPNPPARPVLFLPSDEAPASERSTAFTLQKNMLIMIEPNPATPDNKKGLFLGAMHVVMEEGGYNLHKHPLDFVVV
jgi:hypothetical protein